MLAALSMGETMEKNTMTVRRIVQLSFVLLAGLLSFAVTLFGIASARAIDWHFNPLLSILYSALPILCLPACLLSLMFRKLIALEAILAIAYLADYSALNWRTCSSLGHCGSIASTVLMTLGTRSALAYFAVAILAIAVIRLERSRPPAARAKK
jgi:hypothetical protein